MSGGRALTAMPPFYMEEKNMDIVKKDFGQHIGGAKKELWKINGLCTCDLQTLNAAERTKYVNKNNVWKKPNYTKMVEEGHDPLVVYSIKKIRDALPTKPLTRNRQSVEDEHKRQNQFVEFVSEFRDMAMSLKTEADLTLPAVFIFKNGYIERKSVYSVSATEKCHQLMSNKLYQACNISSGTIEKYKSEIKKKHFGVSSEDKVPSGLRIDETLNGRFRVRKGYTILYECYSYDEALKLAKEYSKEKNTKNRKGKFTPKQLASIDRTGLPDIRCKKNVSGEDFVKDFSIRGGEFGNWLSENDAQYSLNMAYDAFYDFALALGVSPEDVSLGGNLSIAFGSRGSGNATAHYEPERMVINLTKMKGAGSLGHELFHALDDILGRKYYGLNKMLSEAPSTSVSESFKHIVETMLWKKPTEEEFKAKKAKAIESRKMMLLSLFDRFLPDSSLEKVESGKEKKEQIKEYMLQLSVVPKLNLEFKTDLSDKISETMKLFSRRSLRKEDRKQLYWTLHFYIEALEMTSDKIKVPTDYQKNSKRMDSLYSKQSHGYWTSECEMFARAGACFLTDMLKQHGGRDDYLCGHSELAYGLDYENTNDDGSPTIVRAYPTGQERIEINKAFLAWFDELKNANVFEKLKEKTHEKNL